MISVILICAPEGSDNSALDSSVVVLDDSPKRSFCASALSVMPVMLQWSLQIECANSSACAEMSWRSFDFSSAV